MMKFFRNQPIVRALLATCSLALICSSCSNLQNDGVKSLGKARKAYEDYNLPATLPSNPSNVRVKVSLSNRMAYVMEGGRPLLVMPVTVGKSSSPTPTGRFRIKTKNHYYRANTHGYAINGNTVRGCYLKNKPAGWRFKGTPMPYWCEFKSAYGFHTGWMKPFPASGGCLRMHKNVAPKFFRLVSVGTPVSISQTQPEDATLGRNVPRPPDSTSFPGNPDGMMALTDQFFTMHQTPTYVNQ
ncbi:L,D-transpeptidase [Akkermansiaceae bacterium]|nr:L,D-transpeptidase [Akkermansiaceae bacterium]MDA9830287.1 L,D-transpeptidase [Akkermansiaceae bacterium]MDB4382786.1 L,D-transpeptidase [Akkermansiaceae bacterium]MDB4466506.1 L,D-transpeptidase [bacterium]MDB4566395.1 L,D-transpeptidase [Akkermansiaceae bacterium]